MWLLLFFVQSDRMSEELMYLLIYKATLSTLPGNNNEWVVYVVLFQTGQSLGSFI